MGSCLGKRSSNIIFLGLDGAGKTSILHWIKYGNTESVSSTIGFNVETIEPAKNVSFTVWDVHGGDKARPSWNRYFTGCDAIVFVIDGANQSRFDEAKDELHRVLKSGEVAGLPLVVLVNKQDLPRAARASELVMRLGLDKSRLKRKVQVLGTSASTGEGICNAMKELNSMIK